MLKKGFFKLLASIFFIAVPVFALFLSACSPQVPEPPVDEEQVPEQGEEQAVDLALYYVKEAFDEFFLVREVHTIPETGSPAVAVAALEQLIHRQPLTEGAYRVLPQNTVVRGIEVDEGLATVDFSLEVLNANVGSAGEATGIMSIVNTLTEFPHIEQVQFLVEGNLEGRALDWWGHVGLYDQPFSRDLSRVYEPSIWVTNPKPGDRVGSPMRVQGSARVYEATVNLRLLDGDLNELVEDFTTATDGGPSRGDFDTELKFTPPATTQGILEVFWYSPKDGSEMDKVQIPVQFN